MIKKFLFFFLFAPLYLCIFVSPIYAHGFGQQYTLPLPAWLYIYGGALTVFLSFVLAGIFIKPSDKQVAGNRSQVKAFTLNFSFPPLLLTTCYILLKTLSVFFLLLAIVSGFIGVDIGILNFNMTYFWVILFIGGVYLSALIGNVWNILNPWKIMISLMEWLTHDSLTGIFPYPKRLSFLPGVIGIFLFLLFELIFQTTPFSLSLLLFFYTSYILSGMILFGKDEWNNHAEIFTIYFSLLSYLSPFATKKNVLTFHLPGLQLIAKPLTHISLLFFILILLAGTAFDGFKETTTWFQLYYSFLTKLEVLFPFSTYQWIETVFFLFLILSFFLLYSLVIFAITFLTKKSTFLQTALIFAGTLIPIVLGYHIAHYFALFITQGQAIIALVSDPFGYGWNLFGTAGFKPNIALIDLNMIWHIQVGAIIVGHILAVLMSHLLAIKLYTNHKQALLSQIPMLILMIFYTMGGLWLLSQPLN